MPIVSKNRGPTAFRFTEIFSSPIFPPVFDERPLIGRSATIEADVTPGSVRMRSSTLA